VLRRRPPYCEGAEDLLAAGSSDVEAGAEARARLQQLLADLRELPDRQRGALVMRELAGLDYEQIGEALETSAGGAKQAVYEARRALFELARGRDMDCDGVRLRLSDGDRRFMRARAVRAHLRECSECRDFRTLTATRSSTLSGLLPGLPTGAAANILRGALAGGTSGGLGSAGTTSVVAGIATAAGIKSLATLTVVVAAGAGVAHTLPAAGGGDRAVTGVQSAQMPDVSALARRASIALSGTGGSAVATRPGSPARGESNAGAGHGSAREHEHPGAAGGGTATHGQGHENAAAKATDPTPAATTQPQSTPRRHGLFGGGRRGGGGRRDGGGGGSGGERSGPLATTTNVVVPQVQQQVQQVESTVTGTVDQVTGSLPVKTPRLP
jgi:hypothetical protein